MKVFYAEYETRNFTFRCVATTITGIKQALRLGVRRHCLLMGVPPGLLLKDIADHEYNVVCMETGVPYCDWSPIDKPEPQSKKKTT